MKRSFYTILLIFSILTNADLLFAQVDPSYFVFAGTYGGKNYYISNYADTWDNAEMLCIANGGYLAVPNDAAENMFIAGLYTAYGSGWLGLNDMATEGTLAPSNCEALAFTNWNPGEPNDCGGCCGSPALGEDHVEIYPSGVWNDICYGYTKFFVLELHDATVWNGGSADWFNAANWSNGVPNDSKSVIIPLTANNPVINANTALRTLEIQAGATLTVTAGMVRATGQNINVAGTLTMSGGTFIFQTNTCNPIPQNIAGTGTIIFNNLTVNNILGVTATGNFGVRRLLELQNGSLNSNGKLTLLSDAFSTAMLVNNAFAVIGVATVQRLVLPYGVRPAGLGYTYFSNPTDAATMGAALGDDMGIVTNPAYKFNCWLYPAPLSSAPFPNVYLYNESLVAVGNDPACNNENTDKFETAWVAANSASAFTAGKGFCINISGNTLTDITGTLNNGNINVPVTKTNPAAANSGYNLVGNPYPSPIDWDLLHSANAGLLAPQVMRRVATDTYAGTWAYYVAGVSGSGTNGADNKIATMQGFFVRALASGNMQFSNSVRLTSYDNSNFFRNEEKFSVIRLKAECKGKFDETSLYFGKNAENHGNAVKSQFNSAPFPNLFSLLDGKSLAVQGLAKAEEQTAVPVSLTAGSEGWHQLSISHIENMKNVGIFVENKKTGELHNLKIAPFSVYLKKGEKLQEHQIKFFENKNSENDLFTLLPNPASDLVQLVFNQAEEGEISFCDMSGRILLTQKVSGFSAKCDIGSFPKGLFIVKFVGKANSQSLKFVKE